MSETWTLSSRGLQSGNTAEDVPVSPDSHEQTWQAPYTGYKGNHHCLGKRWGPGKIPKRGVHKIRGLQMGRIRARVQEEHSCQRGQYGETHSGREIQGVLGETTNDLSHSTHLALVLGKMERCGPCLQEVLMQVTRLLERALLQCLGWTAGTSLTSGLLSSWGPPEPQEGSQCISSGLNYFVKFSWVRSITCNVFGPLSISTPTSLCCISLHVHVSIGVMDILGNQLRVKDMFPMGSFENTYVVCSIFFLYG